MSNENLVNAFGQDEETFLDSYDSSKYPKPSLTVDMLIFTVDTIQSEDWKKLDEKELKVLLIKRNNHPCLNQWALPGGFIEMNENLEESAARELLEETGLEDIYLEQLYTYGDVDRDPRDRIVSTTFMSLADMSKLKLQAGDDASDAKWFSIKIENINENKTFTELGYSLEKIFEIKLQSDDIHLSGRVKYIKEVVGKLVKRSITMVSSDGIAFDHSKIIAYGLDRLRNKMEYTDIAFNLMPDLFTLSELQQVYELVLNKQYSKANFQRKFKHMITETNQIKKGQGYRPAVLYKFNPAWDEN